jgi:cold shock CspA family protein
MSLMGELNYFFGLTIKQTQDDIFIHKKKIQHEYFKKL